MDAALRRAAKRVGPIYAANAAVKAALLRRDRRRLARRYAGAAYVEAEAIARARRSIAAKRGERRVARGDLHLFWVGANLEQDRSGLLPALRSFGRVGVFEAVEGEYGPTYPRHAAFDPAVVALNSRRLVEQVEAENARGRLDALVGQMWRSLFDPAALRRVQDLGVPTLNISWDDRLPEMWATSRRGPPLGSLGLRGGLDAVLTSSQETCAWYAVEGMTALYVPMASSPEFYRPSGARTLDVVFVGSRYGIRVRVARLLLSAGVPLECYGRGWPNGAVSSEEAARLFGASRIVLGVGGVGYNDDVVTLKLRDFDAPMSGALYVTQRNPDLEEFFRDGEEIVTYASLDECVAVVRRFLADERSRARIAAAGLDRARRCHTWESRFGDLFARLGIVSGSGA